MRQNRCHDQLQRERCCTLQRNLWKVFSLELCPKLMLCVSWPININGKSSAYFLSLFICDMTFQVDALFDIIHSTMGARKVPRTEEASTELHKLGTPRWLYDAQKLFCIILFLEILVCVFFARFITRELAFSFLLQHGYLKWLKRKWSCQEVTHKGGNWTEC